MSQSHTSHFSRVTAALKALPTKKSGNVALTFALAAVPVMAAVGSGIDYSNAVQMRSRLQAAADSGVLTVVSSSKSVLTATGNDNANGDVATIIKNSVDANVGLKNFAATPTIVATYKAGVATADITGLVQTHIMKMFGLPTITVHAHAAATVELPPGVLPNEVALVLDTTASMADNGKIAGLKTAANALVDKLIPATSVQGMSATNDKKAITRISIVPFDQYVKVGVQYKGAKWLTNTDDVVTTYPPYCANTYPNVVYGPQYSYQYNCGTDGAVKTCTGWTSDVISYGAPVNVCYPESKSTSSWYGCVGSRSPTLDLQDRVKDSDPIPAMIGYDCSSPLVRLDSRNAPLKTAIANLTPYSETYIAPGLLWGWRTVSHDPPFADGEAKKSAIKFIILMTDGTNTHSPSYPGHGNGDVAVAEANMLATCDAIKNDGITIYTVTYEVNNVASNDKLKACATDPSKYFDAQNSAALLSAFSSIADKIAENSTPKPRLVQ